MRNSLLELGLHHDVKLSSTTTKFMHSKINLTNFVEQYHRCLTYFIFMELQSNYYSNDANYAFHSSFQFLERYATKHLTKKLFLIFWPMLTKATFIKVVHCQEMSSFFMYTIMKYCCLGKKMVCLTVHPIMKFGLSCHHIFSLFLYLDFSELPSCLLLNSWSKTTKDSICGLYVVSSIYWDSTLISRYATLVHISREACEYTHREKEDFDNLMELLTGEISRLKLKYKSVEEEKVEDATPRSKYIRMRGI